MTKFEKTIIKQLKDDLEYQLEDYAQWVVGVSLPRCIDLMDQVLLVRVVVKTSESELVDGMDISFSLEPIIDSDYFENGPDTMGSSVEDSIDWLNDHGKMCRGDGGSDTL